MTLSDNNLGFLAGGGKTAALMRALDWSTSPLGQPRNWPQSLRSVVGLLLQSQFPMFVAWGTDLGFLYNDPYAEILGAKHPKALGSRFYDIWSEIWPDISPLIDAAMTGRATYREDLPLVMNRKGFDEHTWFTFSYSPVRDESGKVAGIFCAVSETTPKVLAERALRTSEGRLRALVGASSYAIYRMNTDWTEMLELEGQGFIADTQIQAKLGSDSTSTPTTSRRSLQRSRRPSTAGPCSSWSIACGGLMVRWDGRFHVPSRLLMQRAKFSSGLARRAMSRTASVPKKSSET